jgi:DNA modification methylase
MNKIEFGECRETMRRWAKEGVKVQMCVTSPPYYGLRDYGTATWIGGDPKCSHKRDSKASDKTITGHVNLEGAVGDGIYKDVCPRCGAKREDQQIGLELTPKDYIETMCEVFDCVWDILADDGVIWVNIGDSYSSHKDCKSVGQTLAKGTSREEAHVMDKGVSRVRDSKMLKSQGLKNKDLIGIPWMLAFALRERGWYLRQDIIWSKPNPMPESVQDRCTKAHEYIFLLSKSDKYYFDNEAIKEPATSTDNSERDRDTTKLNNTPGRTRMAGLTTNHYETRNKRSVWQVATKPYEGAHFATFPEELIQPCILAGSRVGDIVLDPFMGSGTTAQVAMELGRQYLGCELNPEYEKLQKKRTAQQCLILE